MSYGCITNYEKTYTNYFAHAPNSSSFSKQFIRVINNISDELGIQNLLDLGGGSGSLCREWNVRKGRKAMCTDVIQSVSTVGIPFIQYDLSSYSSSESSRVRKEIESEYGVSWLTTCLDVFEHIDREHIANLLLNLSKVVDHYAIVSISTRPSSKGNKFHSTVIPIETWFRLISGAGFEQVESKELSEITGIPMFSGADENLSAVSSWCRINPFRDSKGHQHYILLRKRKSNSQANLLQITRQLLGLEVRERKRAKVSVGAKYIFNLNFYQDWSFLRSFLDVIHAKDLKVYISKDYIPVVYFHLITNFLERCGVEYYCSNHQDEPQIPDIANGLLNIAITATEGPQMPMHIRNSRWMHQARQKGWVTYTFQHGTTRTRTFFSSSEYFLAWTDIDQQFFSSMDFTRDLNQVISIGSPKLDDIRLLSEIGEKQKLADIFGDWVSVYNRSVLLATNLHWKVKHPYEGSDILKWLIRAAKALPDILFIWKPHPLETDALEVYSQLPSNVLLLIEPVLISADITFSQIVSMVDRVISSFSSVILEAAICKTPTIVLPYTNSASGESFSIYDMVRFTPLSCVVDNLDSPAELQGPLTDVPKFWDNWSDFSGMMARRRAAAPQNDTFSILSKLPPPTPFEDIVDINEKYKHFLNS